MIPAAAEALSALRPALLRQLGLRQCALGCAAGLSFGLLLTLGLGCILPPSTPLQPFPALAASFAVNLAALGLLLVRMPAGSAHLPWGNASAWLETSLIAASALAGIAVTPNHHESASTFIVLFLLFTPQLAAVAAFNALLTGVLRTPNFSRQITLLAAAAAVTALFWSKPLIRNISRESSSQPAARGIDAGETCAARVLVYSPPLATACAWFQDSDAARHSRSNDIATAVTAQGKRFDIVRGNLTYKVWIGSYLTLEYPVILPSFKEPAAALADNSKSREFEAGAALLLLLGSLPVLALGEMLIFARNRSLPQDV